MEYTYKARDSRGEILQGKLEAPDQETAADYLSDRGLSVIALEAAMEKFSGGRLLLLFKKRVSKKDLVIFARQMAVMTSANLPVVQSLRIISRQTENPTLKEIVDQISVEVESGVKLSVALSKYPHIFSFFFVSMVKSGETSGKLDEILDYLANQEEEDYDTVSKIKGAMIYPILIISGLILVGAAMMIFVIPQLSGMLTESGAKLPLSTRILVGTSGIFQHFWWLILIVLVSGVSFFRWYVKTLTGKKLWDAFKIRIPIFGKLFQKIYLVRFTHSMSTLIMGGIPLVAALKVASDVVGNESYKVLISLTIKEVEDGNSVGKIFLTSNIVPKMVSHMLAVGEKTGRMDEILKKLSDFYTREVENIIANLSHIIEPLIMILIGIGTGIMVAAIILPMYQLANTF